MKTVKITWRSLLLGASAALMMTACNPEPDESDLYTFTGETIESFIAQDSLLTDFNYILGRVGYDRMMASYGAYTMFAPVNDAVKAYCDSLYNDPEALIPHNGMTGPGVEGLTDSLCLNIARYHISTQYMNVVSMTGTGNVSTMLGFNFTHSVDSVGNIVLADVAKIIDSDHEVTNGLVHIIDRVIPRYTRFIGDILKRNTDRYSIFAEAFERTGWADSVLKYQMEGTYKFEQLPRQSYSAVLSYDEVYKVGFTLFAETDEVMRANGINSFDDLVEYANNVYGNATEWYDYMADNGLTVNTGTTDEDFRQPFNALNMFVAYHLLPMPMDNNQLVFEKGSSTYWNYAPDADPQDYYETLLPHTLMKVWNPVDDGNGRNIYINRYRTFHTLTNEVGTQGTNHTLVKRGLKVDKTRGATLQAFNGYIHSIDGMMVYDRDVPRMVLHERMRFNCTSLFPELITNGYRYWTSGDGHISSNYDNSRRGIGYGAIQNIVQYNKSINFVYALHGAMRCFQSDQLQYWGNFDFAFKLPPVPKGTYEIRICYPPVTYGAFMQYYIGKSSDITSMQALGIPYDIQIDATDPRIGWTPAYEEDDYGIATDAAMHNRGFMRAPYSFCGHAEAGWAKATYNEADGTWTTPKTGLNCREEGGYGTMIIRAVLGRVELNQKGGDHWMRVKKVVEDNTLLSGIDFIELVPIDVVDNQQYTEDWY